MKKMGLSFLFLMCAFASPVFAYVSVPSTDSDGSFTVTWTGNTVSSCSSPSFPWVYQIKESKSGVAAKYYNITSVSQRSFNITGRSSGVYTYSIKARRCTASNGRYFSSTPSVGSDTITVGVVAPSFSAGGATATEGGNLNVVISKTGNDGKSYTVNYETIYTGGAKPNTDYIAKSGSVVFSPSHTSKTISIATVEDAVHESSETFVFSIVSVSGSGRIGTKQTNPRINDDDAAPSFRINNASVTEGAPINFTVSKVGATARTHTVRYATAHGTAGSADYSAKSGTLTFKANETTKSVTVATKTDTVQEGSETFKVFLSSATSNATISDREGIATINSIPNVSFSISNPTVKEGSPMTFVVTKTGNNGLSHSIHYNTFHCCNAVAGEDYTAKSGVLSFAAGETTKAFSVPTTNDTIYEGHSEAFAARLTSPSLGAVIASGKSTGTANILENDSGPSFAINNVSASEGGALTFTITKSGATTQTHSVAYATATNSASSSDFTAKSGRISFTKSETAKTLTIASTEDAIFEISERFYVNLSAPSNSSRIGDSQGIGTITNDDTGPRISIADTSGSEGNAIRFTVTKTGSTTQSHAVSYNTVYIGGAKEVSDYIKKTGTITFAANETKKYIDIATVEDNIFEPSESFVVNIGTPTNGAVRGDYSALASLADDDSAPSFKVNNVASTEGNNLVFTITKTGGSALSHKVNFATAHGTASASDYTPRSGTLTFSPSQTSHTVSVATKVDSSSESAETITLNLSAATAGATLADSQGVGTINNRGNANFTVSNPRTTEGSLMTFVVTKSVNNGLTHTVKYNTFDCCNAIAGDDYTAKSGTLTFAPTEITKSFTVATINDALYDGGSEAFAVRLTDPSPGAALVSGYTGTANIDDNDAGPRFAINNVSVAEGNTVTFTVTKIGGTSRAHSVRFATAPSTASTGDFVSKSGTLSFAAGETRKTISIASANDDTYENNETFFVNLSAASNGATISDAQGIGTLTSSDTPPSFSIADTSAVEGDPILFTVTKSKASDVSHSVDFNTVYIGSAKAGVDYVEKTGTISFAAGQMTKTISIATVEDNIYEANESVVVNIDSPTNNATLGDRSALSTIINDDSLPSFTVNNASATEGRNVTFTVTKLGASGVTHSINYATSDGTAGSSDYVARSGTLTFAANESSKTISVSTRVDSSSENPETFNLGLSGPSNGATISDGAGIGTINNLANVSFGISNPSANEGAKVTFVVTKTGNNGLAHTLNYNTFDCCNATEGNDYTYTSGTLSFAPGETTKTFAVSTFNDNVFEGSSEAFAARITATSPGSAVASSAGTANIIENDTVPSIAIDSINVLEGEYASFSVTLSNPSNRAHSVNYSTVSGTATTHNDFVLTTDTLTFEPGQTRKTLLVSTKADAVVEDDESFFVNLSAPTAQATIARAQGVATIVNQEFSMFSIADASGYEGDDVVFTVTRTGVTNKNASLRYATVESSANGSDFVGATAGVLDFAAGELEKVIRIAANHDTLDESNESFYVDLSAAASGVGVARSRATGTIRDDDYLTPPYYVSAPSRAAGSYEVSWPSVRWAVGSYRVRVIDETYDGRSGNWVVHSDSEIPLGSVQTSVPMNSRGNSFRRHFRVKGCAGGECSDWRDSGYVHWGVPALSSSITKLPLSSNNGLYNLHWSAVNGATYYRVVEILNGSQSNVYTLDPGVLSHELQKNTSGNYGYKIFACNDAGCATNGSSYRNITVALPVTTGLPDVLIADEDLIESDTAVTIRLAETNEYGISINRYETLSVHQPLQLVSVNSDPEQTFNRPETIIFIANNIDIRSSIELVGPASNIVFIIAGSGNKIDCRNCEFLNFHRISMLSHIGIPQVDTGLPLISTAGDSLINIDSLNAPGALAVDLVARTIDIKGEVTTHQRVSIEDDGSYVVDDGGSRILGAGGVNVVSGVNVWNYENQEIEQMFQDLDDQTSSIAGDIRTVSFKIAATSDIDVNADFDTRTDLLSTVRYQGRQHLTQEGVFLNFVHQGETRLNAEIHSDGNVGIRALGAIVFESPGNVIEADTIDVIAGGNIDSVSNFKADTINMAAKGLINEGEMFASKHLEIWSDEYLVNQYGGTMFAESVKLQSENGFVRNGARVPHLDGPDDNKNALAVHGKYGSSGIKMGTAYRKVGLILGQSTAGSYIMPVETHAHIRGDTVEISAGKGFENVNPYYKPVATDDLFAMRKDLVAQVSTIADSSLNVSTNSYVLNASAFMGVNNEDGLMRINTSSLVNERYRVRTALDYTDITEATANGNDRIKTLSSKTIYYSPPGVLFSMGDLGVKASRSFSNSISYLEVYGDAEFDTPNLEDVGLAHYNLTEKRSYVRQTVAYCGHGYYAGCTGANGWGTYNINAFAGESLVFDPQELDSLFYVNGNSLTTSTDNGGKAIVRNVDPFKEFLRVSANKLVNDRLHDLKTNGDIATNDNYRDVKTSVVITNNIYTDQAILDDVIQIDWTQTGYWDEMVTYRPQDSRPEDCTIYVPCRVVRSYSNRDSETYSVWDTVKNYYDSVVDTVSDLLNEFNWWD